MTTTSWNLREQRGCFVGSRLILVVTLLSLVAGPVRAAWVSSAYVISHIGFDGGGGKAGSSQYAIEGALPGLGGLSIGTSAEPVLVNRTGFAGQLNDPPQAFGAEIAVVSGVPMEFRVSGTDFDGDDLTFQILTEPELGTLSGTLPDLVYLTPPTFSGVDEMTFLVRDAFGQSRSATIRFLVEPPVNNPPWLEPMPDYAVREYNTLSVLIPGLDSDLPAQQLSFSLEWGYPNGAALDRETGRFTWTPSEAQGPRTYRVGVRVSDNGTPPLSTRGEMVITVIERNIPPYAAEIPDHFVPAGVPFEQQVFATDIDYPFPALTYTLGPGAIAGAAIDAASGLFTWTPDQELVGQEFEFEVFITDEGDPPASTRRNFTATVVPPADPPLLMLDVRSQDAISLNLQAGPGYCYRVEASTDLRTWVPLQIVEMDDAGVADFTVRIEPGVPVRWFRAAAVSCAVSRL